MIRVLTWNIGSFYPVKYLKFFGLKYKGQKILHQRFQPILNGKIVSDLIGYTDPDILFLQELQKSLDVTQIGILEKYPFQRLISMSHHGCSILIASKREFVVTEKENFPMVFCRDLNFFPIHLHHFNPLARLVDFLNLQKITRNLSKVIIIGDTNIWQRKERFLFKDDKRAYHALLEHLLDFSKNILSTTCVGFGLDKVFGSKDLKVTKIESPRIRGDLMDHYPIVFELE